MYFVVTLDRNVQVEPRLFNREIRSTVVQKLVSEVEGRFSGSYGFIVAVVELPHELPPGELDNQSGFACFKLSYKALVYRPFKGEVVNALVSRVTQHGFFADAGPLTIFVSHHLIPEDMSYQSMPESFVSRDQGETVLKGSKVRLRIIGVKIEVTDISATGSMRDDFLGLCD
mmetsp:Transcript_10168/g.27145  ORF Transcript_10168/g.27145 Transcript_10168/m.27145 type:complete len:172 (+) Transcript_10168:224-739(+)